jgi:hypothetical protein
MHERFGFEQSHMGRGVGLTQATPANTRPNPRMLKMMARELLYSAMVRVERIASQMLKISAGRGRHNARTYHQRRLGSGLEQPDGKM